MRSVLYAQSRLHGGLPADTDENGNADNADASQRGFAQIIFLFSASICVDQRFIRVICVLQIYFQNSQLVSLLTIDL